MTENINDLTEKIAKIEIEAKFEKWNDFPPEIKLECIKNMDLKMRFRLRSTSHTERELVDSLRYKFESVVFMTRNISFTYAKHFEGSEQYFIDCDDVEDDFKKTASLFAYVLNKCDIAEFRIFSWNDTDQSFIDSFIKLLKPQLLQFKELTLDGINMETVMVFLGKCWKNIDSLVLGPFGEEIPLNDMFIIPSVVSANQLIIMEPHDNQIVPFVEKWSEFDLKNGTRLVLNFCISHYLKGYEYKKHMDEIVSKFKNRKISYEDSTLRISNDNARKHILMISKNSDCMFCVVIPSHLGKSEYYKYSEYHKCYAPRPSF